MKTEDRQCSSRELEFAIFYHSGLYKLMSEGVSDMHCMSDEYLVQELEEEQKLKYSTFPQ